MKKFLETIRTHKAVSTLIGISALFSFIALILVFLNYGRVASSIVLHFDNFRGVDLFGARSSLWGIWILSLIILVINKALAYEFYNRERFLAYLFLSANVFVSICTVLVVAVIASNN